MATVTVGAIVTEVTTGFCGQVVERIEILGIPTQCRVLPLALTGKETADELRSKMCLESLLVTEDALGRVGGRKVMDARRQRKVIRALWDMLLRAGDPPKVAADAVPIGNITVPASLMAESAERVLNAFGYTLMAGEYVAPPKPR